MMRAPLITEAGKTLSGDLSLDAAAQTALAYCRKHAEACVSVARAALSANSSANGGVSAGSLSRPRAASGSARQSAAATDAACREHPWPKVSHQALGLAAAARACTP